MKIAFVSDSIYPYNRGGKEKRLFEVATRLANKGHDVNLFCMKWWNGPNDKIENGVHLHAICKNYPLYSGKRRSISQALLFGFNCLKLSTKNFDIIDVDHMPHFPLFFMKFICLLKRKKMIATWHEVWDRNYWREYLGLKGILGYEVEKFSVLMPNEIISVSKHTTKKLQNSLRFKKKIHTIPNGIDFKKIQEIKSSKRKSDIIFAGRLLGNKNIYLLVKAIKLIKVRIPNIKCLIIGDGPEKKTLEALTHKLNLEENINFLGFLENQDDVYALMKSSKVFVLPSTREGFGIVVIEANACGIPVVTVNHKDNAARYLIKEGKNGFVCQLDEKEIAKNVIITIKNWTNMKQACLNSVKPYNWDIIIKKLEKVYLR